VVICIWQARRVFTVCRMICDRHHPSVVIEVRGASVAVPALSRILSGDSVSRASGVSFRGRQQISARRETGCDPHRMAIEQPALWAKYINAMWPHDGVIIDLFQVDARTVRNWRKGAFAPRAHHMKIALQSHPQEAWTMLIAAE